MFLINPDVNICHLNTFGLRDRTLGQLVGENASEGQSTSIFIWYVGLSYFDMVFRNFVSDAHKTSATPIIKY